MRNPLAMLLLCLPSLAWGQTSYNDTIADAVGRWDMQDAAANQTVLAQEGTNATLAGTGNTDAIDVPGPTTWLPSALHMNGTDHYIDIPDQVLSGELSLAIWAKRDDTSVGHLLWSGAASRLVGFSGANSARSRLTGGTQTTYSHGLADSTAWNHHVITRNSSNVVGVYWNGAAVNTSLATDAGSTTFTVVGDSSTGRFDGPLAQAIVWTRQISTAEVAEIYNGPEPEYTSGATLAAGGALDVGTWDENDNGTATYQWVVAEADGDVLDSGTGATDTADLSAAAGGTTVYLYVRASSPVGGADIGDESTRTGAYGAANDGYYEVASATTVAADYPKVYFPRVRPGIQVAPQ